MVARAPHIFDLRTELQKCGVAIGGRGTQSTSPMMSFMLRPSSSQADNKMMKIGV
jgi:hypothetical protein